MFVLVMGLGLGMVGCSASAPTYPSLPDLVVAPTRLTLSVGEAGMFSAAGGDGSYNVTLVAWEGSYPVDLVWAKDQIRQIGPGVFQFTPTRSVVQYSPLSLRVRSGKGDFANYYYKDVHVFIR